MVDNANLRIGPCLGADRRQPSGVDAGSFGGVDTPNSMGPTVVHLGGLAKPGGVGQAPTRPVGPTGAFHGGRFVVCVTHRAWHAPSAPVF